MRNPSVVAYQNPLSAWVWQHLLYSVPLMIGSAALYYFVLAPRIKRIEQATGASQIPLGGTTTQGALAVGFGRYARAGAATGGSGGNQGRWTR